jgi:hypothetical protein
MKNGLERIWKEVGMTLFEVLSQIFMEELRKATKISVRTGGLWAKICTRDLPDMK